jgi:hypothetical protein
MKRNKESFKNRCIGNMVNGFEISVILESYKKGVFDSSAAQLSVCVGPTFSRFNFALIQLEPIAQVRKFLKRFDFEFEHIVDSDELTSNLGFRSFPVNLFLDREGRLRVIEGNIPYKKSENGELEISEGTEFLAILEGLL